MEKVRACSLDLNMVMIVVLQQLHTITSTGKRAVGRSKDPRRIMSRGRKVI